MVFYDRPRPGARPCTSSEMSPRFVRHSSWTYTAQGQELQHPCLVFGWIVVFKSRSKEHRCHMKYVLREALVSARDVSLNKP